MTRMKVWVIARLALRRLPPNVKRLYARKEAALVIANLDDKGDAVIHKRLGLSWDECLGYDVPGLYHKDRITGQHIIELNFKALESAREVVGTFYHETGHCWNNHIGIRDTDTTANTLAGKWLRYAGFRFRLKEGINLNYGEYSIKPPTKANKPLEILK